ncbi:MAG: helix-turn-helix transcriptional regulator [Treponema sp.]|nr:helix-turn-helix transcriptional regulator [Treponema sp.]
MGTVDIRKVFGENVKHYRKKAGLSQEQLAEKLDISTNHMSVIETGGKFVTYKLLERLVETFGVMPAALFFMPGAAPFDDTVQNKAASHSRQLILTCKSSTHRISLRPSLDEWIREV